MLPIVAACSGSDGGHPLTCSDLSSDPTISKPCLSFVSEEFKGCLLGSPLEYKGPDGSQVIVASGDGRVAAVEPDSGHTLWSLDLPEKADQMAYVVATPTLIDDHRLVVAWQDVPAKTKKPASDVRSAHRVAVVDLEHGKLDDDFPVVELAGSAAANDGGVIDFHPEYALSRASLVHAGGDTGRGYVYVSFGNARDVQPFHGFVFELDLDAWHDRGKDSAISSVLATTSETDCGSPGHSGSFEMVCAGGVWAAGGPEVVQTDSGFEMVIPTGNGALDPTRRDYGHTLMRVRGPGLTFDDGCDPAACTGWDVDTPSADCMQSCGNLFIPRFPDGMSMLDVKSCEGLSFFGCYTSLDWDLGAGSPAVADVPNGPRVVLMPGKDGSLYLTDFEKLGTLYDRSQLANTCGSNGGSCKMTYTGMMMTKPEITTVDGQLLAVLSTFESDTTNPAGLVGVRVTLHDGTPALERAWEAPGFDTDEAVSAFRTRPSRVRLFDWQGETHAAVVDVGKDAARGTLYLVRARDGKIRARQKLEGPGQRFAQPLAVGGRLFVNSCVDGNAGPGHLEAYRVQ